MTYTWTQDQLKLLTYGSTIDGRVVIDTACGRSVVLFAGAFDGEDVRSFNPRILKPPTIEFIRELANEKLGYAHAVDVPPIGERGETVLIAYDQFTVRAFDTATLDRYRAAVAAILALAGAGLGGGR